MEAASGSDPGSECTVRAGETGLEEPLWQLGLVGGPELYPERPGEADCMYYLRTGYCGYGNRCRFNHPRDRTMVMGAMRVSGGDYPERVGQPVCQYYMKTRMCKFGASCKYHHPNQGGSPMPLALNIYGYPLRPGEKECSYYVKTGQCKFGVTCKFHHPQPAGVQEVAAPVSGPALVSPAESASTQPNVGASPVYGVTQLSPQAPAYTGQNVPVSSFPAPSGSSPMSDYFADLPQDVLSDILIRLPLKSIGRSRCISKLWLSLLTSYEFIKARLAHHTHLAQEQKVLIHCSFKSLFSLTLHLGCRNQLRELEFIDERVHTSVGSCNGLVLVATEGKLKWLINCMTEEYVKLPVSPFTLDPHLSFKTTYGLGYDSLSDDYKIVQISQHDHGPFWQPHVNCPDILVDIYSLKMRSWKRLGTSPYGHDLIDDAPCVFLNGALHWIGLTSSHKDLTVIVAFDLSSEDSKEIPVPPAFEETYKFTWAKLMVIDGCLGLVVEPAAALKGEIWLMKSYSLVESWTKFVIDIDIEPLCSYEDKILFQEYRNLEWYRLKDGRVEVCSYNDPWLWIDEGITYSESLVSPHFNYHNSDDKGKGKLLIGC